MREGPKAGMGGQPSSVLPLVVLHCAGRLTVTGSAPGMGTAGRL